MKNITIAAWILLGLESLFVLMLFVQRNMGDDAAGRGMARGFAVILFPILLVAGGLLAVGQSRGIRPAYWTGVLMISSPLLFFAVSTIKGKFRSLDLAAGRAQFGKFEDRRLTAIARAIDKQDVEKVRELIASGPVDFAARDKRDRTILGHAVSRVLEDYNDGVKSVECVRILLEAGAKPDRRILAQERTSYAPEDYELIAAVFGGNSRGVVPLLDLLFAAGASPDVDDMHSEPIIFSTYASVAKLEVLARHGADFKRLHTRTDRLGWNAVMNAAYMSMWDEAVFFVEHGVPIGHVAPDGYTLEKVLAEWVVTQGSYGQSGIEDPGYKKLLEAIASCA